MKTLSAKRILFNRPVIAILLVLLLPLVAGSWVYKEWKSGIVWPEPPG